MTAAPRITYDASGRLSSDVICALCGHNLRGLAPTGVCGECGQPVEWSLRGSPFGAADPAWIGRVRWAAACLTVALPWLWLPLSWPLAYFAYWRLTSPNPSAADSGVWTSVVMRVLLFAPTIAVWIGVCLLLNPLDLWEWLWLIPPTVALLLLFLTAAAHRLSNRPESARLRRLCRLAFCAWPLALLLFAPVPLALARGPFWIPEVVIIVLGRLGVIVLLCIPALNLAVLIGLWRALEVAEVQSHSLRDGVRVRWPGSARSAPATEPGESSASPPAQA